MLSNINFFHNPTAFLTAALTGKDTFGLKIFNITLNGSYDNSCPL